MFNRLKSIYEGKKVFLTGHTGFKGSWMLKLLNILGAEVKGYALTPKTNGDLFYLIQGDSICNSIIDDLRNRDRLISEIVSFKPDFIFHLAAQPLVRQSYRNPTETFEVNVVGTANVLEGLRLLDKPCQAIMITTDKVYHNYEWIYPYREIDRLGGYDPYSASKACAEIVIDSYRNSYFNLNNYENHCKSVAVARAGNVIGGGDWSEDRLIPDIVKSLGTGKEILVRNPKSIRPWQHVIEPVVAYLLLGGKLMDNPIKYSQPYNFGPHVGDSLPVIEIVELAIHAWGSGNYVIRENINEPHEAGLLRLDISKALLELGWSPKWNSEKAVKSAIEWYKRFFCEPVSIDSFTTDQILEFLNAGNDAE